jgi:hypothetical protein
MAFGMRLLVLNGSPRKHGNTCRAIKLSDQDVPQFAIEKRFLGFSVGPVVETRPGKLGEKTS